MKMLSVSCAVALTFAVNAFAQQAPKPFVTGLKSPESVTVGLGGKVFVTEIGDFDKDGDGTVVQIVDGKAVPFASGLDDPKGIVAFRDALFVADKTKVLKIDAKGKVSVFAGPDAFPTKPLFLNDIAVDAENGTMFVSDSGDLKGTGGAIYRIDPKGKVTSLLTPKNFPAMNTPNGLLTDGTLASLYYADFGTGDLYRIKLADQSVEKLADGFGGADGITVDHFGRTFISDWKNGKLFVIGRPGDKPVLVAEGFKAAADTCLDPTGKFILVPDMKEGTLTAVPAQVPGAEVDIAPLAIRSELAFPDITWTDWNPETSAGKPNAFRPILLTHAGDGSKRIFLATQQGVVHSFADAKAKSTNIFLDLRDRVQYDDKTNEEGFLGMAFHPKFKQNGELFVFYTPKKTKMTNIISRFRLKKDNPNQVDPASEEVLLTFTKPFWNHDGGTIVFGPDGYLYVTHGDGGFKDDPQDNGQNLNSILGKILRIDVNAKDEGKPYAIPKDNPFVGQKDTRGEIWAYGFRNIWRMSFDRKTGELWAGDVGQNLWEEIDIVVKGGNYGWRRREGQHPFGPQGLAPSKNMVEPVWEYHHDIGKSITGGHVYRGTSLPELQGCYVYADYVTNKIWALKYDGEKKRVVANRPVGDRAVPIFSFGEDEDGELYWLTSTANGKGIFKLMK